MLEWHLFAVGVNMAATIEDTQDLSTIRGAGLAVLRMPERIATALDALSKPGHPATVAHVNTVYTGASEGLWRLTASEEDARALPATLHAAIQDDTGLGRALRHMRVLIAVTPITGDEDTGGNQALAAARFAQYRTAILPVPPGPAPRRCGIDGIRPANAVLRTKPGQFGPRSTHEADTEDPRADTARVSSAVKDRRAHGRAEKHAFYRREGADLRASVTGVTETFQDMVDDAPDGLRESVKGKLALLYADGNAFGEIRERMAATMGREPALTRFSTDLLEKRRDLLRQTLTWFQDLEKGGKGRAFWYPKAHSAESPDVRLRFETLLWGGDELIWVMPAWAAWDALSLVFRVTRDWKLDDHALTHGAGLVLFQAKTPIRLVKGLAHDLADGAKARAKALGGPRNLCQVLPLESHDIPPGFLDTYRTTLFGARAPDRDSGGMVADPAAFTLDGNRLDALTAHLRKRVLPCFPRSQLYKLLREASARDWLRFESQAVTDWWTAQDRLGDADQADAPLAAEVRQVLDAGQYAPEGKEEVLTAFDLLGGGPQGAPALPGSVHGRPHPPLALAHLATLWDYIDPFGEWS